MNTSMIIAIVVVVVVVVIAACIAVQVRRRRFALSRLHTFEARSSAGVARRGHSNDTSTSGAPIVYGYDSLETDSLPRYSDYSPRDSYGEHSGNGGTVYGGSSETGSTGHSSSGDSGGFGGGFSGE